MKQGTVVDLDAAIALADAVILATARARGATIWTQDAHLEGLRGVRYRKSKPAP